MAARTAPPALRLLRLALVLLLLLLLIAALVSARPHGRCAQHLARGAQSAQVGARRRRRVRRARGLARKVHGSMPLGKPAVISGARADGDVRVGAAREWVQLPSAHVRCDGRRDDRGAKDGAERAQRHSGRVGARLRGACRARLCLVDLAATRVALVRALARRRAPSILRRAAQRRAACEEREERGHA